MSDQPPSSAWIRLDAARRLGARPVALWAADRLLRPLARRRLPDAPAPEGPFLSAAAAGMARDWHAGFDPAAHALDLDLTQARPVWEAHRLGELPRLVMAGQAAQAE